MAMMIEGCGFSVHQYKYFNVYTSCVRCAFLAKAASKGNNS